MTTPPIFPIGAGSNQTQVASALMASAAAQTQASRQILQTLQAMQHQMGVYGGTPQPIPGSGGGGGGGRQQGAPGPVPTQSWFQSQAINLASHMLGHTLSRSQTPPSARAAGSRSMSWMLPGGSYATLTPQNNGGSGGGVGQWALNNAPQILGTRFGPWGAAAGVALQVGAKVPAEVRSQRDKNAFYQSAEGGSNFDGFAERLHEEAYRWSTFGVLSSDEARQAFKGVTSLGYNSKVEGGPGRQQALNFVYHGKTSYGATVDESLQALQTFSQSAVTNLKSVSDALKDVSDSAGSAGINAQQARADFVSMVSAASKGGMTGDVATSAARLNENVKSSLGRSFQGADFSGQLGSNFTMLAAAVGGVKVGDYLTNSGVQSAAQGKLYNTVLANVLKPGVREWVQSEIQKVGRTPLDDANRQDIASRMLQKFYDADAMSFAAALSMVLPDGATDPLRAAVWVVTQIETMAQGGIVGKAAQDIASKDQASQQAQSTANSPHVVTGSQTPLDHETPWYTFGLGGGSKAVDAYEKWSKSTPGWEDDPAVRTLLGTVKGDNSTKVLVTTRTGKKVVTLEDAVANHRDELASGQAVIMEGNSGQTGKSVKDLIGAGQVDPLRDFSAEASKDDNTGVDLKTWESQHSNGSGGLTIGLTPEAKRLLTVLGSSGTAGAAASASPPTNPNAQFPSLPSVGG